MVAKVVEEQFLLIQGQTIQQVAICKADASHDKCLQDLQPSIAGPAEVSPPADAAEDAEEEAAAPAATASGQTLEELTAAAASAQVLPPPC